LVTSLALSPRIPPIRATCLPSVLLSFLALFSSLFLLQSLPLVPDPFPVPLYHSLPYSTCSFPCNIIHCSHVSPVCPPSFLALFHLLFLLESLPLLLVYSPCLPSFLGLFHLLFLSVCSPPVPRVSPVSCCHLLSLCSCRPIRVRPRCHSLPPSNPLLSRCQLRSQLPDPSICASCDWSPVPLSNQSAISSLLCPTPCANTANFSTALLGVRA
jgi:hypothetical protein